MNLARASTSLTTIWRYLDNFDRLGRSVFHRSLSGSGMRRGFSVWLGGGLGECSSVRQLCPRRLVLAEPETGESRRATEKAGAGDKIDHNHNALAARTLLDENLVLQCFRWVRSCEYRSKCAANRPSI